MEIEYEEEIDIVDIFSNPAYYYPSHIGNRTDNQQIQISQSEDNEHSDVDVVNVTECNQENPQSRMATSATATLSIMSQSSMPSGQQTFNNESPQPGPSGIRVATENESDIDSDDSIKIIEVPKKTVPVIFISDSSSDSEIDVVATVPKKKAAVRKKKLKSIKERLEDQRDNLFPVKKEADDGNESPTTTKHDSMCAICLGTYSDRSFLDNCFHSFCFTCIIQWSKVVHTCPLCKTAFKSIIHDIQPDLQYTQLFMEKESETGNSSSLPIFNSYDLLEQGPRFRYRTTITSIGNHISDWYRQNRYSSSRNRQRRSRHRWGQQPSTWGHVVASEERRRSIYRLGMVIKEVKHPPGRIRYRDTSVEFFRDNPAIIHRLVPWILRDLKIVLDGNNSDSSFVLHLVMSLLVRYPMESDEFFNQLHPFLHNSTRQFIRELISFASSPYDMRTYDSRVVYDMPTAPISASTLTPAAATSSSAQQGDASEPEMSLRDRLLDEMFEEARTEISPPLVEASESRRRGSTLNDSNWNTDSDVEVTEPHVAVNDEIIEPKKSKDSNRRGIAYVGKPKDEFNGTDLTTRMSKKSTGKDVQPQVHSGARSSSTSSECSLEFLPNGKKSDGTSRSQSSHSNRRSSNSPSRISDFHRKSGPKSRATDFIECSVSDRVFSSVKSKSKYTSKESNGYQRSAFRNTEGRRDSSKDSKEYSIYGSRRSRSREQTKERSRRRKSSGRSSSSDSRTYLKSHYKRSRSRESSKAGSLDTLKSKSREHMRQRSSKQIRRSSERSSSNDSRRYSKSYYKRSRSRESSKSFKIDTRDSRSRGHVQVTSSKQRSGIYEKATSSYSKTDSKSNYKQGQSREIPEVGLFGTKTRDSDKYDSENLHEYSKTRKRRSSSRESTLSYEYDERGKISKNHSLRSSSRETKDRYSSGSKSSRRDKKSKSSSTCDSSEAVKENKAKKINSPCYSSDDESCIPKSSSHAFDHYDQKTHQSSESAVAASVCREGPKNTLESSKMKKHITRINEINKVANDHQLSYSELTVMDSMKVESIVGSKSAEDDLSKIDKMLVGDIDENVYDMKTSQERFGNFMESSSESGRKKKCKHKSKLKKKKHKRKRDRYSNDDKDFEGNLIQEDTTARPLHDLNASDKTINKTAHFDASKRTNDKDGSREQSTSLMPLNTKENTSVDLLTELLPYRKDEIEDSLTTKSIERNANCAKVIGDKEHDDEIIVNSPEYNPKSLCMPSKSKIVKIKRGPKSSKKCVNSQRNIQCDTGDLPCKDSVSLRCGSGEDITEKSHSANSKESSSVNADNARNGNVSCENSVSNQTGLFVGRTKSDSNLLPMASQKEVFGTANLDDIDGANLKLISDTIVTGTCSSRSLSPTIPVLSTEKDISTRKDGKSLNLGTKDAIQSMTDDEIEASIRELSYRISIGNQALHAVNLSDQGD